MRVSLLPSNLLILYRVCAHFFHINNAIYNQNIIIIHSTIHCIFFLSFDTLYLAPSSQFSHECEKVFKVIYRFLDDTYANEAYSVIFHNFYIYFACISLLLLPIVDMQMFWLNVNVFWLIRKTRTLTHTHTHTIWMLINWFRGLTPEVCLVPYDVSPIKQC